ncbi:hypothetical protein [Vibrio cholerae]|uniref:hypothetical protein n=1 Tax=Vibrio cholerae TaxID=666 RepID=UPI002FE63524
MYYANIQYEITICPPTLLKQTTEKLENLNEGELIEQGVKLGLQFSEHDVNLTLSTSADEKLDEGILKIYNLSSDLVDYLLNNDGLKVAIKSNNIKDAELISHGIYDVQGVEHDDSSSDDHETTITLAGSASNIKNSYVARSFPRQTSYKTIINEISSLLGLNVGYVDTAITGALSYPLTFAGNTHTVLTRLANLLECKYSVTNNTVHFFKKDLSGEYRVSKTVYNDQMITMPNRSKKRKQNNKKETEKDVYTFTVIGCPIVANDIFTIEDNPEQKLKATSANFVISTVNGAYQSQVSYQII